MKLLQHDGAGGFREVDIAVPTRGVTTVNFGAGAWDASVQVAAPGISAAHSVRANVVAVATPEHSIDEHWVEEDLAVVAGNVVPGVGFTIYARAQRFKLSGRFSIGWDWG